MSVRKLLKRQDLMVSQSGQTGKFYTLLVKRCYFNGLREADWPTGPEMRFCTAFPLCHPSRQSDRATV